MKKITNNIIAKAFDYGAVFAWIIYPAIVLSVLLYAYFVSMAVFDAAQAKQISIETKKIVSSANDLETSYMVLSGKLTLDEAKSLGFHEVSDPVFVSRKSLGSTLSMGHEI